MRTSPILSFALALSLAWSCHNQNDPKDRGTPKHLAPDTTADPAQPIVVTPTGPVSSVPAATLGATVPVAPPVHDGAVACHVEVENLTLSGREYSVTNSGNVDLLSCRAVIYVYDKTHAQIARVALDAFDTLRQQEAGQAPTLPPRQATRGLLPIARIAGDNTNWFEPVVTHVEFRDGLTWDAPPGRAPAVRPFSAGSEPHAM